MKSKTRLDSALFQLTPTRTRCDLYIITNGKKEKIASGLLNPFIAHLKTAQDQIAEGGYSVLLEPEAGSNATWFTKGTVESFVRFVSTPDILERVYTIESEILQIEEAIAIQGNNDIMIEDQRVKPVASNEGNKPAYDPDEEKAIVLYKPGGAHETKEGNSKVRLLNVLETRKTVLKKEQGMAFARAVAAGFEIEHVANLLSFAECFGASRLMSACLRFLDLWKQKHESGQWVEMEAEDTVSSSKSDYSAMNASGIVLSSMSNTHNNEPRSEATTPETKGKPGTSGEQQYHTGQFSHPVFPPWAMHSSPGAVPVYHMQGLPYYQHYPGSGPFYPPPSPMEDLDRHEQKRQSEESSFGKSGRVVIRNINYINSKTQNSSSDSDSDSLRSPKKKGNLKESEPHWEAFQSYLLKGVACANEIKRKEKTMDPLAGNDHFMVGEREEANGNTSMDYDLQSSGQNPESKVNYEAHDLRLMPERDVEKRFIGYDPALDYERQLAEDEKNRKEALTDVKKRSKVNNEGKKFVGPIRKGKPSKANNTLEDARVRADKLRSFKADLQKMKKEQQEAEVKRLEALKMERRKRIAARANSISKLPTMPHNKFTDSEPGSSSPLQRSKITTTSLGIGKKLSTIDGNRLTRSMPLPSTKKQVTPDSKSRITTLSEPKHTRTAETVSKTKPSQIKKNSATTTSKLPSNPTQKFSNKPVSAKQNPTVDKTVVTLQPITKEFDGDHGTGSMEIVEKGTISIHPSSCESAEVRKDCMEEKRYEAPYARVSSFEDPSTRNSEYAKAPQTKFGGEGEKAFISDFNNLKLEKIPEVPQPKEAKGFRRLLKFGNNPPSVDTLKTLISQDQTPIHRQKPSRHLSLFSSLRGEKKRATT